MNPGSRNSQKNNRLAVILVFVAVLSALGWASRSAWQPQVQAWLGSSLSGPGIDSPSLSAGQIAVPSNPVLKSTASPRAVSSLSGEDGLPALDIAASSPTDPAVAVFPEISEPAGEKLRAEGVLVFSMQDGPFSHLFAYHPLYLPFTRLTNSPWDDRTPAISPDGTRIAYSSRQNGYWDIYSLDLTTGQKTRLTDTPDYEGSPTWSPDGQWIAFERYNGTSLDIYIQSLTDPTAAPIQLTNDPGIDRSPAWSPKGREIAFVSSRSGNEEIWLARLDQIDDRFLNISQSPLARDRSPAWSADGRYLAWAAEDNGDRQLATWDAQNPDSPAWLIGEGDRAAWSFGDSLLFSEVREPNETGLAAYTAVDGRLTFPLVHTPGAINGMTWVKGPLPAWLSGALRKQDSLPPTALWQPLLTRTVSPAGRMGLSDLPDVSAPQPRLHDAVDEAFSSLRGAVAAETGWDALSSLENAYLPLTSPPSPSLQEDWLYTGRAFALNPLLLSAGWMSISREDFNGQTYWRVYLKARYQDGSMGSPLADLAWDLNARFAGDPRTYEQGGQAAPVPAGYWFDLTEIANRYGWNRLPSWINWRTYYPSIRYNQFVMTGGLDWHQAMAELYPPEALMTTTPMPTSTPTVTETLKIPPRLATATPSPTVTNIPTRRPTWTPLPTQAAP